MKIDTEKMRIPTLIFWFLVAAGSASAGVYGIVKLVLYFVER